MTLSDISAVSSSISGIAVVASLAFLYFQMKQLGQQVKLAEKNQMASIRQNRSTRAVDLYVARVEATVGDAFYRGSKGDLDMSDSQLTQYLNYCAALFIHFEDSYGQHRDGLLNDSAFCNMCAHLQASFRSLGLRAVWKRERTAYRGEFVEFMDNILAEPEIALPAVDRLEQWKMSVTAELTGAA